MNEKIIEKIVIRAFEKAKAENISHSKYALSQYISDHSNLSIKTLERAYERYINGSSKHGRPQASSIDMLCEFLGYKNYLDYISSTKHKSRLAEESKNTVNSGKSFWRKYSLFFVFGFVGTLITIFYVASKDNNHVEVAGNKTSCMTWADSLYIKYPCDKGPYSDWGTKIVPSNQHLLNNMKKVSVSPSYNFFNQKDQPLVWYYKLDDSEVEFYTSPGLHPVHGKTLKAVTKYIIEKYVPVHQPSKHSFVE